MTFSSTPVPHQPASDDALVSDEPPQSPTMASLDQQAVSYVARAQMMVDRARKLVIADRVDTIDLLANRRQCLGEHFKLYQVFKHTNIFNPIVEFGAGSSKIVARSMKMDCLELGETYRAYVDRWLRLKPQEWRSYQRDMLAIAEVISTHLATELTSMKQLLTISQFYRR